MRKKKVSLSKDRRKKRPKQSANSKKPRINETQQPPQIIKILSMIQSKKISRNLPGSPRSLNKFVPLTWPQT